MYFIIQVCIKFSINPTCVLAELLEPPSLSSFDDSSLVSSHSPTPEPQGDAHSDATTPEHEVASATLSSPDVSDPELQETSHDDSAEHIVVRERRDSGVGSSLTRTNRFVLQTFIKHVYFVIL